MSVDIGAGASCPLPFYNCAQRYADMGLPIFPCGREDGKKPLIKSWKPYQSRQPNSLELGRWIKESPEANIGLVTGSLSGVTVIDSDNPQVRLNALFERFGETPVAAQTPRGGYHLYYRFNGEKSDQNRNEKIDVRGQGGYVIAPPSVNPVSKNNYQFILGGIEDIETLPFLKTNLKKTVPESLLRQGTDGNILEGERNKKLFDYIRSVAKACPSFESLSEQAIIFNASKCVPPLPLEEVKRTSQSVWNYKLKDLLFVKGEQIVQMPKNDKMKEICFLHPRAFGLYWDLLASHGTWDKLFAISPEGYQKRCTWKSPTIRKAINILIDYKLIQRVHKGGKYKGDVSLYLFP